MIYLSLIYILAIKCGVESTLKEQSIIREALNTSAFLRHYKNIYNDKLTCEIYLMDHIKRNDALIFPKLLFGTYDRRKSVEYLSAIIKAAIDILTDEKLDFLLYIIINTISEGQYIGSTSPFAYLVFHHVRRMYLYCKEMERIKEFRLKKCCTWEIFEPILNPYNIRPAVYLSTKLMKKIQNDDRLSKIHLENILYNEMIQVCHEYSILKKDFFKKLNTEIYNIPLRLAAEMRLKALSRSFYLQICGRSILEITVYNQEEDMEKMKSIHMTYWNFEIISRMHSAVRDYVLDFERIVRYAGLNITLNKHVLEVCLGMFVFYNTRYDIDVVMHFIVTETDAIMFTIKNIVKDNKSREFKQENNSGEFNMDNNLLYEFIPE